MPTQRPGRWLDPTLQSVENTLLLVANLPITDVTQFWRAWDYCKYHVLLDGAASIVEEIGAVPDLVVGDGDSITEQTLKHLAKQGVEFVRDTDQYSTDFMKGISQARAKWPNIKTILVYGALGGRVDHSWHSQLMLSRSLREDYDLILVSSVNVTIAVAGVVKVSTPSKYLGKSCGVMPLDGPTLLTTEGLEWDVTNWETSWLTRLTTSNYIKAESITIKVDKPVLVTIEIKQAQKPVQPQPATEAAEVVEAAQGR